MRRTRKWAYVAQEARRLADLGVRVVEIAERLSVNRSTVHRWMDAGKMTDTRRSEGDRTRVPSASAGQPSGAWAAAVRQAYALDATDEQLVELAEAALTVAQNPGEDTRVRLSAMGRYQALVKQLALIARPPAVEEATAVPVPAVPVAPRAPRADPRAQLLTIQ